ncbi:MAG: hypothetical protein JXQ29_17635 [Planctomycetes bacterium]|nr:hypothetical protein [Planctomycetota bacterium]
MTRSTTRFLLCAVGLLLGAAFPAGAQKDKYEGIRWVSTFDAAMKEGRDRGCPVLAVLTSNSAHDQVTGVMLDDKSVIRESEDLVCVVGHNDYRPKEKPKKGEDQNEMICPHYGTVKIKELVANYGVMSARFVRQSAVQGVVLPQHIYIDPVNDEELFRRLGGLTRREMSYDIARALKLVGKGLPVRIAGPMREKLDEAAELIKKGQFERASEFLDEFRGFKTRYEKRVNSALFKDGDDLIVELESKGQDLIREARTLADGGDFDRAKQLLERVQKEFRPFEISDRARKALSEIRRKEAG